MKRFPTPMQRFLQREAVRLAHKSLRDAQAACHCCQRPLQNRKTCEPDYGYVARGRTVCVECLPAATQLPAAEADSLPASFQDAERTRLAHDRQRFVDDQQQRHLREHLLYLDPHCDRCRCLLKRQGHARPDYAHVVSGRLSCRDCVRIVRALAIVEAEAA